MAINAQLLLEAIEALEVERGISRDVIVASLKESMEKSYKRHLGGDDADVRAEIDLDNGIISLCQVKRVVKEVEDDFLEVSVKEANELDKSKKYKDGDEFFIYANIEELRKAVAMAIKSGFRQKIAEAEKTVLYEQFKDKIGTMITGKVEKVDEKGVTVNIGRTSVLIPRQEMIGDEKFNVTDPIKLFVKEVNSDSKGAHIKVSRGDAGFLKALMTEEIHEIYDGTIEIRNISRRSGERSKVAVSAKDPNVDPAGACIGHNGTNIQKVVAQLGNGSVKEKIDIITYSDNKELFIIEAMKPAIVLGVAENKEDGGFIVVVPDDNFSQAIGRKGVNIFLASKLVGTKITVKTESQAEEEGIEYKASEVIREEASKAKPKVNLEEETFAPLKGLPEGYVAPQERVYEDETPSDVEEALQEEAEKEELEVAPKAPEEEPVKEPEVEQPAPVKEEVKEVVLPKEEVKTTTTLDALEKSLEEDKNKKNASNKRNTKKKKEEEQEESAVLYSDPSKYMSIYSEEELKEMEEEDKLDDEEQYEDEDIDYDEYDEYYDDDVR